MPAKISFLPRVASIALATHVVEGVDRRTVDELDARQRFNEFGKRSTLHAVAGITTDLLKDDPSKVLKPGV